MLQIHDELLLEVPDVETTAVRELVIEEMVGAYPLDPPLAVDSGVGDDWLAAKSLSRTRGGSCSADDAAGDRARRYNPARKRRRAVRCRVESEETPYRYAPNER